MKPRVRILGRLAQGLMVQSSRFRAWGLFDLFEDPTLGHPGGEANNMATAYTPHPCNIDVPGLRAARLGFRAASKI